MIGIEAEILNLIRKTYNSLARWNVKEYLTAGSDTFVVPTGVREIYVTLQGGGGGGAGSVGSGSETYGSMGGGSGSLVYRWKFKIPYFLSSFSVNIGDGGEGGVASSGSDGGTSYIGSYWIGASGGQGGQANNVTKSLAGYPGFPYLTTLQKENNIYGVYLGWGNPTDFAPPVSDSNGENCKFYATRDANNPSGGWWYGSPFDDGCWIIVGASAGGRYHFTKSGDGGGSVMGGYSGGAGSSDTVGNTYLPGSGGGASCFGAGGAGGVGTGDPTDGGGYGAGGGAASTALSPGIDKTGANGIAGFVRIEWVGVPYGS